MNKFFNLLYVNLLDMFNFNKIAVARKEGVKSNLEIRTVVIAIFTIIACYIVYSFMVKTPLSNSYNYLGFGFLFSTFYCFLADISLIEPVIFNSSDNDVLFSYPITKNQIVFSKLFSVYLKNIFVVLVIMLSCLLAFARITSVNETLVLLYLVCTIFIPFVPIIVCTLIAYINAYLKVKCQNIVASLIRLVFFVLLGVGIILVIGRNSLNGASFIEVLVNRLNIVYPYGYLFLDIVQNQHVLFFFLFIFLNILFIYLYNSIMSDNIMKICSMLQGINKKHDFKYKKSHNAHQVLGIIRKELINLFNNRTYLFSSFGITVVIFALIIIGFNVINIDSFQKIENFSVYFNNYGPALLGSCNSFALMTISSMSLEKEHFQILRSMPVSMTKIIFSKWLINVLLASVFVIIEAVLIIIKFNITKLSMILWIAVPLMVVMFMCMTGILLDYVFISKREKSDNVIVRQRVIVMIVPIISLTVGLLPIFLNIQIKYNYFSGAYLVLLLVLLLIEVLFMVFNRKKLITNLFN